MLIFGLSSCERIWEELDKEEPSKPEVKEFVTGLATPLALELDNHQKLWVTQAGTGNSDGRVSLITPAGKVYPVIEGFVSVIDPEGNPSGLNHLLYTNGTLWILHGAEGRLYKADVNDFKPGDAPLQASDLEYEEIDDFVLEEGFDESNPYNLVIGPGNDLFITDAAANAIIRRNSQTAELSIFAQIPPIENPTPIGPPLIHAVPTGIVYNGHHLLITTFTGFPFLEGEASVYEIDSDGDLSVYQDELTNLIDIELGFDHRPVVLQFSEFGEAGWVPGSGKMIQVTDEQVKVVQSGFSFASDMELIGPRRAYVTNLAEGKVLKVKY